MRILYIEDDPTTAKSVELMLTHANLNVYHTDMGEEGVDLAMFYDYDMIITDYNLPDINGVEVLRRLRGKHITTPVIALSGHDETDVKLQFFEHGADDFISKPFHREELICRIHAIIRRYHGHSHHSITTGNLEVDLHSKMATVDGNTVHLTGKEFSMLEFMSLRKGMTLTKEMFLNHLYGGMDEPELKIVDVFICKLRKKLTDAGHQQGAIETVWGRGYRLVDQNVAQ